MRTLAQDMAAARGHQYAVNFETGCWDWFGPKDRMGYGRVGRRRSGGQSLAHRYFYIQCHGATPDTLDHLCRNPGCVNPDHLEATTRQENVRRGIGAKLNWDLVTYIRESPLGNTVIAREIGVSPPTVCNVRAGRIWKEEQRP